jgi:hypothetical protein
MSDAEPTFERTAFAQIVRRAAKPLAQHAEPERIGGYANTAEHGPADGHLSMNDPQRSRATEAHCARRDV